MVNSWIMRRCFVPTAVFIVLTLLGEFDGSTAERWSRQISNSEWIPLANPRVAQLSQSNVGSGLLLASGTHVPNPIQSLALPPALQQQYQEQLIQLQKTQESIQKLLLLQQQLKAQQQLLQSQTFLPDAKDEKQALLPSSLGNLQTAPESVSPEVLVPPHPFSEAIPPVYSAQSFLPRKPGQVHQNLNDNQELSNLPVQEQIILQHNDDTQEELHTYVTKQGSQRPDGKRLKERPSSELSQSPLIENDEEEEVQLVYVPAETLAQTGQLKRGRGRKQYPVRQQIHRENQRNVEQTSLSPNQETYARQVLQQIQKEQEEKAQFLKEERIKEFTRLNEEQKALERKIRLQQEALQREQELLQQKEAEKKRKELERLEEMARQRELERIREAREKQRQEELERRRLAELRAKEEKRREEETREREERQKQLEQQRILEGTGFQQNPQALIREQAHRQHLTDSSRVKKIRGRQRQRVNQNQEQSNYREATTTPSPNQPPLSVYMGSPSSRLDSVKVTDVLKILKDAKSIAVLDNVGPGAPQVFVGPSNLDPPYGYAKFDLPYLSSIDHNRVERKVDKLPFFVAPLSFDPPPGYAKIPFPAPHIGSVVVNTLSETPPEPNVQVDEQNSSPTLIEPNSYNNADQSESIATTASYESSTAQNFSPESSNAKYESSSGSRFRFRQFYDNKPSSVISTSYYDEQSITKTKPKQSYYEQESKSITQSPKFDTTDSYRQEIPYSNTPNFQDETVSPHDPSTKKQDLTTHQLALIKQELAQQIETQKYNAAEQYRSQANLGESYDTNDVRAPVGPTQYNLPAELPPISPHLPGLVNSLLDKQEESLSVASTPPPTTTTPTTTTTTVRVSSTTYRPRGRGRTIPTRPRTTQTPSNKNDRTRRPSYNRSKSRFSTTTEDYRETSYEPTKAKIPETTQKYNAIEHRRPTSRTQKYRNRDKVNSPLIQTHQTLNYENYPTQSDSQNNASPDAYSSGGSASSSQQKETSSSGVNDYTRENYPSTTPTQTENYQPLREIQHSASLVSDDYSKSQNYPQNHHQDATYDQNSAFEQQKLEQAPINGFNYQVANENSPDQTNVPQKHKEYSRYQENANYNLAITEDPRIRPHEEHQYSPIYEVNVAQTQPDYNIGEQNSFRNIDNGKIEVGAIEADPNASPIFVPLQQSKQEDYELQIPSTEASIIEITTTSTTTPAPVIIRQRVRGRLSGRTHQDSTVQTRPRGSQDEYVRFSVVNHDSRSSPHRNRDGSRTKTRTRSQKNHGSQVQTENNEYIKIHAAQQQKLIATTTPSTTTTTTTTTTAHPEEEDIDYGFIRPPSFRPVQPVHPVDTRFQAPVTYRPALSEIQHVISNDETAVESSPTHILKSRPKYNQIPTRHPTTKIFTTTTEPVPVATVMPDNTVYTVKSKTKPDEPKQTRIRGRIRRPGKKRTMTSTESGLEANNELPLDENYPRMPPQQPVTRQPLYDDNFDMSQFVPNQNRQTQFYEENSENYSPQEFILNFGNLPEQMPQREEYDQTQLASISSSKYSHSDHVSGQSSGDIYGSESQWSTKLSKTSFQPSFTSNRMIDESKKERGRIRDNQENRNAPEIITARPEMLSGIVVSSDYQKSSNETAGTDAMMDDALFGMKTNVQDHIEKLNVTTAVTTLVLQNQTRSDKETSFETRWREDNSAEQAGDDTMKKTTDPLIGRKTRRRRVRVKVRPVSKDDFVTAESQHFNSAVNNLIQDQYKYNPIRESKFTTVEPITIVVATTTSAAETTQKSLLEDFLEEMLKKNDEVSIPTRITSIPSTTEIPIWAILTPTTTPMTIPYASNDGKVTKENYTQTSATLTSNIDEEHVTMTNKNLIELKNDTKETISFEQTTHLSQEETEIQKEAESGEYWDKDFQEDKSEQNNLENVEIFNEKYNLPSNYPNESKTSKEDEDTTAELTNFSTMKKDIQKLSAINKGKEHIMTLKKHEENIEENDAHPKNHRIKWSEVKYPLTLDKSQSTLKMQFTTPIPGVVTRNEGDSNVKTLSDYVKAIFDSMKSTENQEEVEEIAKVVETKNETPKADQIISTTDSSRDIFTTQHINIEENVTNFEEVQSITETTMKENTTIFETTTVIPDMNTDTHTVVSSEETIITEPSTTTSTAKPMTSIGLPGTVIRANSTQTMLGKVLRTSTTTKVSHMTEICYRGRCVMTRPNMDGVMER